MKFFIIDYRYLKNQSIWSNTAASLTHFGFCSLRASIFDFHSQSSCQYFVNVRLQDIAWFMAYSQNFWLFPHKSTKVTDHVWNYTSLSLGTIHEVCVCAQRSADSWSVCIILNVNGKLNAWSSISVFIYATCKRSFLFVSLRQARCTSASRTSTENCMTRSSHVYQRKTERSDRLLQLHPPLL